MVAAEPERVFNVSDAALWDVAQELPEDAGQACSKEMLLGLSYGLMRRGVYWMTADCAAYARWLVERHFIGAAFEDTLFYTDNNLRERACSWKIMSSMRYFGALANDACRWRAVGIPLNLLDYSLQGDIDLLVAMLPRPKTEGGRLVFPPPIYRCFELKTAKVSRNGDVKSLKTAKFHKTMGQLEKLCDIGAQQVFLLETFIVEAGYSNIRRIGMPPPVREAWRASMST